VEDSALSTDGKESVEASPSVVEDEARSSVGEEVRDPTPQASASANGLAALERERWFRDRFEKEHQVTLAMMRLLVAGVRNEGQCMRFWRWMIDDLRSERRLLDEPDGDSWNNEVLLRRVRGWFSRRGADSNASGGGLSERRV
jgi:hypothetical protein